MRTNEPNNIIAVHLTKEDLKILVLTFHELERKMLSQVENEEHMALSYPVSKLLSQLDTALHKLGLCKTDPAGCAYEENQVTHYKLFKKFIDAEIKPGNKTV